MPAEKIGNTVDKKICRKRMGATITSEIWSRLVGGENEVKAEGGDIQHEAQGKELVFKA